MAGGGVLDVSTSALSVAMAGVRVTQHNIANASTPGYHRQEVSQIARTVLNGPGSAEGVGVEVGAIERRYNEFLEQEVRSYQAKLGQAQAYSTYASKLDELFGKMGLDEPLSAFFASTSEVANDPSSMPARQQMLSSANNLAERFQMLSDQMHAASDAINKEIGSMVGQANTLASQIASLNDLVSKNSADGKSPPNDLLDQRDQLVNELSKIVDVNVDEQRIGNASVYNVYLNSGHALVAGKTVRPLSTLRDSVDPTMVTVGFQSSPLDEGKLQQSGGRLAGLIAYRNEVLKPAMLNTGLIAIGLADQFNTIHEKGYGLNDDVSRSFFSSAQNMIREPVAIGATVTQVDASLTDVRKLQSSGYQLNYDGSNYILTRLSDGATSVPDPNLANVTTINGEDQGFSLTTAGTPVAGDSWAINLTADGAGKFGVALSDYRNIAAAKSLNLVTNDKGLPGDNQNMLELAALQSSQGLMNGTANYHAVFNETVSWTATRANLADSEALTYGTMFEQAQVRQQAESGVNLDEEAVKLIQYQQAYQAAAKAIQISSEMMQEIISIMR